ncbi:CLUMA_CG014616, isoform A [Clunio marinus]|uniref:CLUMA_CG014616, isoform A n=1 Tax=Clunio marinus TaxID=568069 RepID=A0A1J1ILY2_9DIPT|nr:CLUMA_CG014616, isoform A [Clunio marinus]
MSEGRKLKMLIKHRRLKFDQQLMKLELIFGFERYRLDVGSFLMLPPSWMRSRTRCFEFPRLFDPFTPYARSNE